jgi:hypothetical protein
VLRPIDVSIGRGTPNHQGYFALTELLLPHLLTRARL